MTPCSTGSGARLAMLHRNTTGVLGQGPQGDLGADGWQHVQRRRQGSEKLRSKRTRAPVREIKGAARRSVRPKSREETPKEGSEASDEVASLAKPNLDVRRTKRKRILLQCRNLAAT